MGMSLFGYERTEMHVERVTGLPHSSYHSVRFVPLVVPIWTGDLHS